MGEGAKRFFFPIIVSFLVHHINEDWCAIFDMSFKNILLARGERVFPVLPPLIYGNSIAALK